MQPVLTDFTDDDKPYLQLIFPSGVDVLDGELNDLQRRLRVSSYYRSLLHHDSSGAAAGQPPVVRAMNLRVVPSGDGTTVVLEPSAGDRPGIISVRGVTWIVTDPVTASGSLGAGAIGSNQTHEVYIELREVLVTEADDPNIEVQDVGPTAGRRALSWNLRLGAANGTEAETATQAGDTWKPNVIKAGVLAEVRRKAGDTLPLNKVRIIPRWAPAADWLRMQHRAAHFAASDPVQRSFMQWNSSTGQLVCQNVALYLPDQWDTTNATPLRWKLPNTIALPSDGDSAYVVMPAAPKTYGDTSSTPITTLSSADIKVINAAAHSGHVPGAGVASFPDLLKLVASRVLGDLVLFDGRRASDLGAPDEELDFAFPVGSGGVLETPPMGSNAADGVSDLTPYMRGRMPPQSGKYKLVEEMRVRNVNHVKMRRYVGFNIGGTVDSYVVTMNAMWNTDFAVWLADDPALPSSAEYQDVFSGGGSAFGRKRMSWRNQGAGSTWTDNAWAASGPGPASLMFYASGRITASGGGDSVLDNFNRVYLNGAGDPAASSSPNQDGRIGGYSLNLNKGWGFVFSDGAGGINLSSSRFNLKAVVINGAASARIELHSGFSSSNHYTTIATLRNGVGICAVAQPVDGSRFDVVVFDNTGAIKNWATTALAVNVLIMGDEG